MLPNISQSLKIILLAIFLSVGLNYAYAAWSNPTDPPPPIGGNIEVPINVGATAQTKIGNLATNGVFSAVQGLFGTVGVGSASVPASLRLQVAGNIGADNYCDRDGNNCIKGSASGITFPDGSTQGSASSGVSIPYPYMCFWQTTFSNSGIFVGRFTTPPPVASCKIAGDGSWTYLGQSSDRGGFPGGCYCWKIN